MLDRPVIPEKKSSSQGDLLQAEWSLSSSGGPLVEKPETSRGNLMLEKGVDLIKAESKVRSRGEPHNSVEELSASG
jgi:hypothetical protein